MTRTFKLITIISLILITKQSFAEIRQQIHIQQSPGALHFTLQIENTENLEATFLLTGKAENLTTTNSQTQKTADKISLKLGPGCIDQIRYSIPIDANSNYAITADDFWTPVLQTQTNHEQKYSLSADVLAGYALIDSAIGYAQDDFAFVLCKCHKYSSKDQRLNIYLLQDEPALAKTLLDQLEIYLQKFETEYGPYPYASFSVVESEQEVGFAFPKMTWIGNQLLHFPFILKSSLPHELLHSWWGNGVFVDYDKGNWCEGMTTLGADYELLSDADKKLYRLKAITNYLDYAQTSQEIPLSKFISRGEDRSLQAIGYDKSLMVLLMLEHRVGEKLFKLAQKEFYGKFRYKKASYEDFFSILSQLSGLDLNNFQNFWLYSVGILPDDMIQLQWNSAKQTLNAKTNRGELAKIANLQIETQIQFQNQSSLDLNLHVLASGQDLQTSEWTFPALPITYNFDPDFYLFRKLHDNEKPTTFSEFLGAKKINLISDQTDFANLIKGILPNAELETTHDFQFEIPHTLILDLSTANLPREILSALQKKNLQLNPDDLIFSGKSYPYQDHSLFVSMRIQKTTILMLRLGQTLTPQRWLQRWTHYGAKGYLILNSKSADEQGLWLEPYSRPL